MIFVTIFVMSNCHQIVIWFGLILLRFSSQFSSRFWLRQIFIKLLLKSIWSVEKIELNRKNWWGNTSARWKGRNKKLILVAIFILISISFFVLIFVTFFCDNFFFGWIILFFIILFLLFFIIFLANNYHQIVIWIGIISVVIFVIIFIDFRNKFFGTKEQSS